MASDGVLDLSTYNALLSHGERPMVPFTPPTNTPRRNSPRSGRLAGHSASPPHDPGMPGEMAGSQAAKLPNLVAETFKASGRRCDYTVDLASQKLYMANLNQNRFRASVSFDQFKDSLADNLKLHAIQSEEHTRRLEHQLSMSQTKLQNAEETISSLMLRQEDGERVRADLSAELAAAKAVIAQMADAAKKQIEGSVAQQARHSEAMRELKAANAAETARLAQKIEQQRATVLGLQQAERERQRDLVGQRAEMSGMEEKMETQRKQLAVFQKQHRARQELVERKNLAVATIDNLQSTVVDLKGQLEAQAASHRDEVAQLKSACEAAWEAAESKAAPSGKPAPVVELLQASSDGAGIPDALANEGYSKRDGVGKTRQRQEEVPDAPDAPDRQQALPTLPLDLGTVPRTWADKNHAANHRLIQSCQHELFRLRLEMRDLRANSAGAMGTAKALIEAGDDVAAKSHVSTVLDIAKPRVETACTKLQQLQAGVGAMRRIVMERS